MVWLPDDVWAAGGGGKGKGGGCKGGWTPVWQPMFQKKGWGKGWGKGKGKSLRDFPPTTKVWIGGLASTVTWKELQEHMNTAGKTKWCEVFGGKGAGTGAVAYSTDEEAAAAIATLNGSALGGQVIQCDTWVKKEKEA
mmetsp:Transcript_124046/g.276789  ORF Transcript_124046/g.276789 Transcript_124046/m.276789 type:complete len:138 (-) Transcript_124046:151-564(-)